MEPGTPLAAEPDRHPDEDAQADRYEETDRILAGRGYRWEEISNWARPGHECRHNGLYWDQGDYRGIGSAAHSHRRGRRWWNVRTPDRYVAAVGAGRSPLAGGGGAHPRTAEVGGDWPCDSAPRPGSPWRPCPTTRTSRELVDRSTGRAVLTVRGRLLANAVTARLVSDGRAGAAVAGKSGSTGTIRPYA